MWGGGGCESCLALCLAAVFFGVSFLFFCALPFVNFFWCLFVAGWQTQCEQTISKSIGFLDGHTE